MQKPIPLYNDSDVQVTASGTEKDQVSGLQGAAAHSNTLLHLVAGVAGKIDSKVTIKNNLHKRGAIHTPGTAAAQQVGSPLPLLMSRVKLTLNAAQRVRCFGSTRSAVKAVRDCFAGRDSALNRPASRQGNGTQQ